MARTNKKKLQIANKKRHLTSLKGGTVSPYLGMREEPIIERKSPTIIEKKTFLIICEGKNTEPSYFNQFKLKTANIKALGEGYNTVSLVERAVFIVNEEAGKERFYDEIWCVFDKDDFSNEDFNTAILIANRCGFKVAYSNQSFEYWLLLHINDHQGGKLDRKLCCKKINDCIGKYGINYDDSGSKDVSTDFFTFLIAKEKKTDKKNRIEKAILRAEAIDKKLDNKSPALEESSTKVYLLVKEIMKYL